MEMEIEDLINALENFKEDTSVKILDRGEKIAEQEKGRNYTIEDTVFRIILPSSDKKFYVIELEYFTGEDNYITGYCTCPYYGANSIPCKHQIAGASIWLNYINNIAGNKKDKAVAAAPQTFSFKLTKTDSLSLQQYIHRQEQNEAERLGYRHDTMIKEIPEKKGWSGSFSGGIAASVVYKNEKQLTVTCNCRKLEDGKLCAHAIAICHHISKITPFYFYRFRNYLKEKNLLLGQYGLTLKDELSKQFKFDIDNNGTLIISQAPPHLLGTSAAIGWDQIAQLLHTFKKPALPAIPAAMHDDDYATGLLFDFNRHDKGGFSVELLKVKERSSGNRFKKIPLEREANVSSLFDMPAPVVRQLKQLTKEGLLKHLVSNGFHQFKNIYYDPWKMLTDNHRDLIQEQMRRSLDAIRTGMSESIPVYYLLPDEKFNNTHIKSALFSTESPALKFVLHKKGSFLELHCMMAVEKSVYALKEIEQIHFFFKKENVFFLIDKKDEPVLHLFNRGMLTIHEREKDIFLKKVALPLAAMYEVDFGGLLATSGITDTVPQGRIYLSELNDNYLQIAPRWLYGDIEVDNDEEEALLEKEGIAHRIVRNKEEEKLLIERIRSTHSKFRWQNSEYFYLSFNEALEKNWFISFYNELSRHVPVYGINKLKKFRYRPAPPSIEVKASSGLDWFDIEIEVKYDGIVVPLQELRKAIINKQSYILLSDGSMGMLPQEWVEKYALMMKMGQVKNNRLQVSKFNWTIIDDLHEQLDNEKLLKELQEKKSRLLTIEKSTSFNLPEGITARPRHYQESGFQWLCLLDKMGWGGCLADDMGLGKTLQTIMLLQHVVKHYPKEKHLVVCPTSLIYNWEAELQKFAPSLSYYIHYGAERSGKIPARKNINIIITTYGLLRSDMEKFSKQKFGYVIIDESHTIKNPASQIAKAVRVLKARNRLALSGTPLQNNTFDLYSQMEFLNPGMLGGLEFFKSEFANPIDKQGDKEKAEQLRKMIYPFMLRRTKEQVAKDLPDRTESVIWCEMEEEQRKIYNSFKEHYRQRIMGHIEEDGLGKSTMYVLEGLTRLRQVCDSPAIIKEEDASYPNHSVKLQELTRELAENTGTHKALVFSQFTTMLQLIRESLETEGISYCYLDGSTPAAERKKLVKQFQEKEEVRVFLISLKAGGMGLNLTAADYVYLVDPWWNPAAEQQAIDRTHRIGQKKKVFAYKMICKNTIEEKIILLQEKKKKLSTNLISDEAGFVKKLTKDDIAYLFE